MGPETEVEDRWLTVSLPLSLTFTDFPDKENIAIIIFFTGCKNGCPGCHNPELQDFNYGIKFTATELFEKVEEMARPKGITKIVLSGGDPYFQDEIELDLFLHLLYTNGYEICMYTGITDLVSLKEKFWPYVAYYKCGKYDERIKEKEWGKFSDKMVFATKNQKLYDGDLIQLSIDNVYYFNRWGKFKAKVKKFLKRV